MQQQSQHLRFLREKIADIQVALFRSEIDTELTLPNNIIQTLKTDEEGNIYFFTSCDAHYASQIDEPFYAYLDYYKKGAETRLKISGRAEVVSEESQTEIKNDCVGKTIVLIKLKIMQAEYSDKTLADHQSWASKLKSSINHLFFPSHNNLNLG